MVDPNNLLVLQKMHQCMQTGVYKNCKQGLENDICRKHVEVSVSFPDAVTVHPRPWKGVAASSLPSHSVLSIPFYPSR